MREGGREEGRASFCVMAIMESEHTAWSGCIIRNLGVKPDNRLVNYNTTLLTLFLCSN